MNEIEKQILKNQATIMTLIVDIAEKTHVDNLESLVNISNRMEEIKKILNPSKEKPINEQTKDALLGLGEQQ